MSRRSRSTPKAHGRAQAPIFAALGDGTRLTLIAKLCSGESLSISELTAGSSLTRQAITKHLRVLERAGIVRCMRRGRESLFALDLVPIEHAKSYLGLVSEQWDQALHRLKKFVEKDKPRRAKRDR
jgi:DNA-binding transcriptional ArsR family regulator